MKLTKDLVLGSASPRRAQLLRELGFEFSVVVTEADERAPEHLSPEETAIYVSEQKARALQPLLSENQLGITSDTEVWLDGQRLGKPADETQARAMLEQLSGRAHQVVSGLTLVTSDALTSYSTQVVVHVKALPAWAIDHYIATARPLDKAGAYGIQEWMGMAFIDRIEGEYNSVVGLPTATLFEALSPYLLP